MEFDNAVADCVELRPEHVELVRNTVMLAARLKMRQSLAACGCKTALAGYRVQLDDPWHSGVIGRLNTLNRPLAVDEQVYLLLATDAPLIRPAHTARVTLSCVTAE